MKDCLWLHMFKAIKCTLAVCGHHYTPVPTHCKSALYGFKHVQPQIIFDHNVSSVWSVELAMSQILAR